MLKVLIFVVCCELIFADPGYFTPKAYYVIDKDGKKSDVVYLTPKIKREISDKLHLIRKRDTRGDPKCEGLSTNVQVVDPYNGGIPYGFPGPYFGPGMPDEIRRQFEAAFQYPGVGYNDVRGQAGRFGGGEELSDSGELEGVPGVSVSSNAQGEHGAWSSSSTSIDSNGKAKYNTKSGKF